MVTIQIERYTIIQHCQACTVLLDNVPLDWGMTLFEAVRLIASLTGELFVVNDEGQTDE